MNNVDEYIKILLSKEISEPNSYNEMIKNTINDISINSYEKRIKKTFFIKILVYACACMILTTGIVFAEDISNFVINFFNNSKGVDTAIHNGYIGNINMEYIQSKSSEIKIDNLLMDDYNLDFTVNFKLDNNLDVDKIININIPDIIIVDDDNNVLYYKNKDDIKDYPDNLKYMNNAMNSYIKLRNSEDNLIYIVYNIFSSNFPKSKKITIQFNNIELYMNEKVIKLTGNWRIEVNIPEKFYNRENVILNVINCNDNTINVSKAVLSDTEMEFEFCTKIEAVYDENDSDEVKKKKIDEYKKIYKENFMKGNVFIKDEYIVNEKGEIFYPCESNSENKMTHYSYNGEIEHQQIFNINKYTMTNRIEVHFSFQGKDIVIELERK